MCLDTVLVTIQPAIAPVAGTSVAFCRNDECATGTLDERVTLVGRTFTVDGGEYAGQLEFSYHAGDDDPPLADGDVYRVAIEGLFDARATAQYSTVMDCANRTCHVLDLELR